MTEDAMGLWHAAVGHEAAHVVVAFLLGVPVLSLEVYVHETGDKRDIGGRVLAAEPLTDGCELPARNRACLKQIKIALAGHAFEAIIGLRENVPISRTTYTQLSDGDRKKLEKWLGCIRPRLSFALREAALRAQWHATRDLLAQNRTLVEKVAGAVLAKVAERCGERLGAVEVMLTQDELNHIDGVVKPSLPTTREG